MPFHFQKIADYGTSTPEIARLVVQASRLMQFFLVDDELNRKVTEALFETQRHVIRCLTIRDRVRRDVEQGLRAGAEPSGGGGAYHLPSVVDLRPDAESFLQATKMAIRDTAGVLEAFYGESFGHRFDKWEKWSRRQLGDDDLVTGVLAHWEPWVKDVVGARDAVEHPSEQPGGRLEVQDFKLIRQQDGSNALLEPSWRLSRDEFRPIVPGMGTLIEGVVRLAEDLLGVCLIKRREKLPPGIDVQIVEIPEEERDPSCPCRLRAEAQVVAGGTASAQPQRGKVGS